MTPCIAALDIGGTKAHLVIETLDGRRIIDDRIPSRDWDAEPAARGAAWIVDKLRQGTPQDMNVALAAVGAQGVNSAAIAAALEAELATLGYRSEVVNDAALVAAAAGFSDGVSVIAGTGAIAVGRDRAGRPLSAGGWGSVIGDEGGAAALVREAARAALRANDAGEPDDGLLSTLIASFGVANSERLTRRVNDDPTARNWAPHCPAVFEAAQAGSKLAVHVVSEGGRALAVLVGQLVARGATGADAVVAGGVILNQPLLFEAFAEDLRRRLPLFTPHRLAASPVEGAVFRARQSIGRTP